MTKPLAMFCGLLASLGTVTSPANGEPAMVANMGVICTAPWAGMDTDGNVLYVLLEGVGTNVDTNNAKGIKNVNCHIYPHTSEPVWVMDMFTGDMVEVTLLSVEDACVAFGVSPCLQGDNGTAIFGEFNAPGGCWWNDEMTTDWRRHVTPSGQDALSCKFPARKSQ